MTKADGRRLGNLLGALALALTDEIRQAMDEELAMTGSAAAALLMVGVEEDITIERIAKQLHLAQPTMVRTIALLEEQRLVRKERTADRRVRQLSLTTKGKQKAARLLDRRARILGRYVDALDTGERLDLGDALEKLLAAAVRQEDQKYTICRLCNEAICGPEECPVERGALRASAQMTCAARHPRLASKPQGRPS